MQAGKRPREYRLVELTGDSGHPGDLQGAEWQRGPPPEKTALVVRVPNLDSCKQVTEREVGFVLLPFVSHLPIFVSFMFHTEPGQATIYSFGPGLENHEINPGILGQNSTPAFLFNGRDC